MKNIVITPKNYRNLSEVISEKNIINSVNGNEYVVTEISDTVLDDRTLTTNTENEIFDITEIDGTLYYYPKYNSNLVVNSQYAEFKLIGALSVDEGYARTEALVFKGSYRFTTNQVLSNDDLSVKFTLNYTQSGTSWINDTNYNRTYKTSFFDYSNYPKNPQQLSTDKFLEVEAGRDEVWWIWKRGEAVAEAPRVNEYCKAKIVEKTASTTTIEVSYKFRVWAAWNQDDDNNNVALCVNSIQIQTLANTVDTEEVPFDYPDDKPTVERNYELETNELFQVNSTDALTDTLSYKTYQEIVGHYDTDRRVVSFDLLSPIKYTIDDSNVYTDGASEVRYLDTNDEFTLYENKKDENGEFKLLGDFRVIQCEPIWDGSYHKLITAIMLDD